MLFDPVTKRNIELKDEGDLLVVRETVPKEEIRKILDRNKEEYNAVPHKQYKSLLRKDSTRMWKAASIPAIIVEKWKKEEGLDLFKEEHWPRIREKLNSEEYRFLRTSPGKI